jgi:hypothetical protein
MRASRSVDSAPSPTDGVPLVGTTPQVPPARYSNFCRSWDSRNWLTPSMKVELDRSSNEYRLSVGSPGFSPTGAGAST